MGKNHVVTASGFEVKISPAVFDDYELLELVGAADSGDIMAYPKILGKLLGADDKARLCDHIRTEDGRVPIKRVGEEITEIFKGAGAAKN